jgi:glycolate oxidase iron-sulfur subunit
VKVLPRRFAFGLALLESSAGEVSSKEELLTSNPAVVNQASKQAMLFKGCVGEGLFNRVNVATRRVLAKHGFRVAAPSEQVCCGALHAHAGDLDGARSLARRNLSAFAADDDAPIVTNAGGCGAMLLSYEHLLSADPSICDQARSFSGRVRDVGQLLLVVPADTGAEGDQPITYDASCHLMYAQHAADDSLRMLRSVADRKFVPLVGSERCCGGAGIYNLLEPELSQEVLSEKIENLRRTGATVLATGNPGCQMQIGAGAKLAGLNIRVCHPVELLDEWYQRSGRYNTSAADSRG